MVVLYFYFLMYMHLSYSCRLLSMVDLKENAILFALLKVRIENIVLFLFTFKTTRNLVDFKCLYNVLIE
jgi:hypothetical protein